MCKSFFSRIFTPPTSNATKAAVQSEAVAQQAAIAAAEEQKKALEAAAAAAVSVNDSESARKASEARLRKLMSSGFGGTFGAPQGQASVGYKLLMGA